MGAHGVGHEANNSSVDHKQMRYSQTGIQKSVKEAGVEFVIAVSKRDRGTKIDLFVLQVRADFACKI